MKSHVKAKSNDTMSGRWTQYGVQGLEAAGVDVQAICQTVGLSYETVANPAAWIDHALFSGVWSHAVRVTGDPNLGLLAAEQFEPAARDLLSHLLISSSTLGQGMARATSFFRLAGDSVGARLSVRGQEKIFCLAQREPDHSAWVEFRLAAYWRFAEMAAQQRIPPVEVRFRHSDRGAARGHYERVYRCPVRFSAADNGLVVSDELLATPLAHACEETAQVLEKAVFLAPVTALTPEAPRLENQVRLLVRSNIPYGDHSESAIANALNMSERTLKRRLAEAHCNFTELVDDIRRRIALDLILTTPHTLEKMAHEVGYNKAGSLVRAVKRWTGHTPATLRSTQASKRSA